jgi:hypothetical protein
MKFLIDGHRFRVQHRMDQWPEGVLGQLLTPLTRYKLGHPVFAIDNGAFSGFNEREFKNLLRRQYEKRFQCLFVAVPDKVGCHATTLKMWEDYSHLADGWRKAFVAQNGFSGFPKGATTLFVGGNDKFKDSDEVLSIVAAARLRKMHVHIGRVNGPERFKRFMRVGAHTCDGSGVSRYDHMIEAIRDSFDA